MSEPTTGGGAVEELVAAVVDDFRVRRARGETPDPAEYAARHPEAAGVLLRVLAAFRLVAPAYRLEQFAGRRGVGPDLIHANLPFPT